MMKFVLSLVILLLHHSSGSLKQLQLRENVVFKKVSEVTTTNARWRLTLVIEIEPYDKMLEQVSEDISRLYDFISEEIEKCRNISQCTKIVLLMNIKSDIKELNDSRISVTEIIKDYRDLARHKRSVLPFVGDAMSFLFGTTSERDLNDINEGIRLLSENQMTIKHVLEKSLTILNGSKAEIAENRQRINSLIIKVTGLLHKLVPYINRTARRLGEIENSLRFIALVQSMMGRIREIIHEIRFVMEEFKVQINLLSLGKLTPITIPPSKLREILMEVQDHLPKTLKMPTNPDTHIWNYYRLLKCTTVLWNRTIVVTIDVPLLDARKDYEIYRAYNIPIPNLIELNEQANQELNLAMSAEYRLESKYIAINTERTRYALLDESTFQKCSQPMLGFCEFQSPARLVSTSKACVISLFVDNKSRTREVCDKMVTVSGRFPDAIYITDGFWVIITMFRFVFTVVCQGKGTENSIVVAIEPPVGVLNLEMSCSATSDYLIVHPYYEQESLFHVKRKLEVPFENFNFSELGMWEEFHKAHPSFELYNVPKPLKGVKRVEMNNLIEELNRVNSIKEIESRRYLWLYVILILLGACAVSILLWRKKELVYKLKDRYVSRDHEAVPEVDHDKSTKPSSLSNSNVKPPSEDPTLMIPMFLRSDTSASLGNVV